MLFCDRCDKKVRSVGGLIKHQASNNCTPPTTANPTASTIRPPIPTQSAIWDPQASRRAPSFRASNKSSLLHNYDAAFLPTDLEHIYDASAEDDSAQTHTIINDSNFPQYNTNAVIDIPVLRPLGEEPKVLTPVLSTNKPAPDHTINRIKTYMEITGRDAGSVITGTADEELIENQIIAPCTKDSEKTLEDIIRIWAISEGHSKGTLNRLIGNKDWIRITKPLGFTAKSYNTLLRGLGDNKFGEWTREIIHVERDGECGDYEIFYQNVIDIIRLLIGHEPFREVMTYAPVREFNRKGTRVYTEAHTADMWWDLQEKLAEGVTVIPIHWHSDETHLTEHRGEHKIHPIYLSIMNLASGVRNQHSRPATLPIATLPMFKDGGPETADFKREVLHVALRKIFKPLEQIPKEGIIMRCADGAFRRCFPILACLSADYPEQVQYTGVSFMKHCVKCQVHPNDRAALLQYSKPRTTESRRHQLELQQSSDYVHIEKTDGQKAYSIPNVSNFTDAHPNVDIHQCIAFDVLHVFFSNGLVERFITFTIRLLRHTNNQHALCNFLGKKKVKMDDIKFAIDDRLKQSPPFHGFDQSKSAYSNINRRSGKEWKTLAKILVAAMAPILVPGNETLMRFIRAFCDFITIAQYRSHDEESLSWLQQHLEVMDTCKSVFTEIDEVPEDLAEQEQFGSHDNCQNHGITGKAMDTNKDTPNPDDSESEDSTHQAKKTKQKEGEKKKKRKVQGNVNVPKFHMLCHVIPSIMWFGTVIGTDTSTGEALHAAWFKALCQNNNWRSDSWLLQILNLVRTSVTVLFEQDTTAYNEGQFDEGGKWRTKKSINPAGGQKQASLAYRYGLTEGFTYGTYLKKGIKLNIPELQIPHNRLQYLQLHGLYRANQVLPSQVAEWAKVPSLLKALLPFIKSQRAQWRAENPERQSTIVDDTLTQENIANGDVLLVLSPGAYHVRKNQVAPDSDPIRDNIKCKWDWQKNKDGRKQWRRDFVWVQKTSPGLIGVDDGADTDIDTTVSNSLDGGRPVQLLLLFHVHDIGFWSDQTTSLNYRVFPVYSGALVREFRPAQGEKFNAYHGLMEFRLGSDCVYPIEALGASVHLYPSKLERWMFNPYANYFSFNRLWDADYFENGPKIARRYEERRQLSRKETRKRDQARKRQSVGAPAGSRGYQTKKKPRS